MKTFTQFSEDLDKLQQRRRQLRKRQLEKSAEHKQRISDYQESRKRSIQKQRERDELKKELKRELQVEQTPEMQPNFYSQQIARRQAAQKTAQIKHVHQELGSEARSQESAKQRRLKAIMSR